MSPASYHPLHEFGTVPQTINDPSLSISHASPSTPVVVPGPEVQNETEDA